MKFQEDNNINVAVGNGLYNRLFDALQTASLHEIRFGQYLYETKSVKKDPALLLRIEEITSLLLPERMGHLIGALDLHNSFLSLGRYIRSFADAEFVVERLQIPILSQLDKDKNVTPYPIIDKLVLCCDELLETISQLMP